MNSDQNIRIRPATIEDKDFILSLVPRLSEFGPPPWRNAEQMSATDAAVLSSHLLEPSEAVIFIVEDENGGALGFIHLQPGNDYYHKEPHGHIADIIVAPDGEGRGIGKLLMAKAEEWAREHGYRRLTLSVFAQNVRARELYGRLGYGEDMMKFVKELNKI
jgi:ribosomal protein S18 acetylase RimI-like enzyme